MLEGYVLAGEVATSPADYATAFERYETRLKDFVQRKQKNALSVGSTFVPKTRLGIGFRNVVTGLIHGPLLARIGLGDLDDDIYVPDYGSKEH